MGLDMYLNARRHLMDRDYTAADERALYAAIETALGDQRPPRTGHLDGIEVEIEVAYWRKANHIHQWFVTNVQEGKDECVPHYVDTKQLVELRDLCLEVIASPEIAKEKLPTQGGFFFGGTEYDEYYFDDLKNTVEQLDRVLKWHAKHGDGWDLRYQSSW